ncbi:unnamed protein product [Peronospora destructor]|uniref:Importin N-terminal domain-containing protein n=1 Tax=Peronospora destructor TaxID=86335 RepID=A0AAV0SWS5_9STRA|nr:unnamed protein product [Peronospora destructor]
MSSDAIIADVEAALHRLLNPSTSSADKIQLEQQLTSFKETPDVCVPVLFTLLRTSQNEYSLWFAATTLEEYVAKRWVHFPISEQLQLRNFVWDFLQSASSLPSFVHRKLRKVVADIAIIQWSDATQLWPNFYTQLETLIIDERSRENGLELLNVVVDEFGRDDTAIFATIKRQAKTKLISQLPHILSLLANILTKCSHDVQSRERHLVMTQDHVAHVALTTLINLITWTPVVDHVTESWLSLLFQLVKNWESGYTLHRCVSSATALQCLTELMSKRFEPSKVDEIVAQVMVELCPLLQKTVEDQVIGKATEQFLDKLSEFVEVFLTQHLKRLENSKYERILPSFLESVYALTTKQPHVEGFLNCLSIWEVFVSYLEEVAQNEGAANERTRIVLTAYEKGLVAVMLHLVERVSYESNRNQLDELDDEDDAGTHGDHEDADSSAAFDLESTDAVYGIASLQDLAQIKTHVASGNASGGAATMVELSERKQFIVDCIALIRRIAALASCAPPLLEHMLPRVQEAAQKVLFHVHEIPVTTQQSDQWQQQRCVIRDLTANCAILSSVCAYYYSVSNDMNQQMAGWQVLHMFVKMSEYMAQHRLHTRGDAFAELQCEALTSIRCCLSCIPFVIKSGARQDVLNASESVIQVILQTLDTSIVPSPLPVMQNSIQLLANLGFVLSYENLVQIPSMTQLEAHVHQFSLHLPLAIQGGLYTSMSNSILDSAISLRGNSGAADGSFQQWENGYGSLLVPIRESINQSALALHQNEQRVLEHAMVAQLRRDCYLVRCLARSVETKPKVAKDAFFSIFQSTLPSLMALLTTYFTTIRKMAASSTPQSNNQVKSALKVVNEIVRLYAQLLKSVRKEMQKENVSAVMRTFVEIFNDSQLSGVLYSHGNAGLMVLCGFLQLLKIVVEEPTSVFSSFLQNILDLCFGPLKEPIFSHPESDFVILSYFVALVEQLLEKHYRFFIVHSGQFTPDGARERNYASDQAHTYFLSIFQSLASVLSREGSNLAPRICKQVLGLLDRIDKAQGLFAFTGFQSELRMGFLSTLMNLLTRGEMSLLQDEIIQLLHRVAAVDFASFYQVFLPGYVKEILTPPQLEAASKMEGECLQWSGQVDFPTFSQEVVAFLNDLKVIKAQN